MMNRRASKFYHMQKCFVYDRIRRLCVFQSRKSGEKLEDGLSSVVLKLI